MGFPDKRWSLPPKEPGKGKYAWSVTKAAVNTLLTRSLLIGQTSNTRKEREREILAAPNARITGGMAESRDVMGD